jgi:hypothetical protein
MSVEIGQLLKLLDMIPDKKGKRTFIEKLPSAQKLDGGNLSGLMSKLVSGNLSDLFKNPLSAIMGPLQQLLGAVMNAQSGGASGTPDSSNGAGGVTTGPIGRPGGVGAPGGANPFADAIGGPGGLIQAVQGLAALSGRLSGEVAPAAGEYGFTDLVLHESILDQLGDAAPASMTLAVAAAPLEAGGLLSNVADTVYRYNTAIMRGQMSSIAAAPDVISYTAQINAIVSSSVAAIAQGEAMAPKIAQVQTAAGMLVSGSPDLQKLVRTCLQPSSASAMDAAMSDRLTIRPPDTATTPPADPNSTTTCY